MNIGMHKLLPNNSINNAFDWIVKLYIAVSYQKYVRIIINPHSYDRATSV